MRSKLIGLFSYLIVGALGVASAFVIVNYFIARSVSQELVEAPEVSIPSPPPIPAGAGAAPNVPTGAAPNVQPPTNQGPDFNKSEQSLTNVQPDAKATLITDELDTLMTPYNYDLENRRDPFKEFRLDVRTEVTEEGVFVGPLRPLQRFELEMIIPVAIIWDVESPKAMFIDPTNEVHILGKDERIGKNNGYIAAIREGEVVVIETVKRKGQLSFKTSILKIGARKK